jgi:C4-type Zn-finger protein
MSDDWPLGRPHPEENIPTPASAPPDMSDKAIRERMDGENVIDLRHANQEKVSDNSDWKVECPFCTEGLFLVQRNQNSPYQLLQFDKCLGCGQHVRWLDIKEMRQKDGISP